MSHSKNNGRINLYIWFVIIVAALISYRLFTLSYIKHSWYSSTAQAQNQNITNVLARGNIYLKDPSDSQTSTYLAATNKKFPLAYIVPAEINASDAEKVAEQAAVILNADKAKIINDINTHADAFHVIVRKISTDQVNKIKTAGIKGFGVAYETDRFYPGGDLAGSILGFLGYGPDGRAGQYGIEALYDSDLFGKAPGSSNISTNGIIDIFRRLKNGADSVDTPADIVLTVDKNIQAFAEDTLEGVLKKWNAAGGTIIIQEPKTGKILAMADRPTFDPNNYSASSPGTYLNRSTQEVFEPGSSYKPFTMAMGLDLGKVTPSTTYTDPGVIDIAGHQIHNFDGQSHGTVSMTTVLEKSLNTGAAFVENLVGQENFLNYTINFGFGQKTGIDLPGEVNGDIANLYSGRQINYITASFGQGVAVTPLQLITGYSMIANGGKLMRPYIVDRIIRGGGKDEIVKPEIIGIPISAKTASKLTSMLVDVVDHGFDKARITGYDIAGKTGTAQIPDGKGGYETGVFIHDFIGFAPAYNPQFVVLIKMDRPKGITFAADSLSPVFKEMAQYLINYYKIPPTR